MKSKASIKGHPLHPMLIPFPLAFFIGTLVFDLLGYVNNEENFWTTGKYLEIAGIISALLAAVPGIVDYFGTVPAASSAKKRATKHGLINITNVVIFSVAAFYRRNDDASAAVVLGLESLGAILLCIAGWLGGTLVYRNQIGVDPRYANAGRWKEQYVDESAGKIEVATVDELKTDQMKLLHIKDKRIVIGRTEQGYVAFDDRCTHKGGSLAGGAMICGTVQCPWHGSQFDVQTGMVKAGPAKEKIGSYPVTEAGGKIYVTL
jgi:uncharacterized membrane protein/nitrite reductase/ring-hydroxylating ferredoxin subunit